MHYFKRNIGDYHKKAGRLTMVEHGAYTLLLDACYDRERFPTEEEAIDWCWARNDEEIAAVKFVLSKFFTFENGIYVQHRVKEEIEAYKAKSENNARIAREREAKRRKPTQPDNEQLPGVHDSCGSGDEAPPNHKPITTNQEPITNKEEKTSKKTAAAQPASLGIRDLQTEGVDEQTAREFLAIRRRKRAPLTDLALKGIRREADRVGWSLDQTLKKCIERGWQGFEAQWVQGAQAASFSGVNRQEALEARNREVAERLARTI